MEQLDDLVAETDMLGIGYFGEQLDYQSLWQHNHDLAAKLQLLLPPLLGYAQHECTRELRALLSSLSAAMQNELANGWGPHELRMCSAGPVEALCRLRPAPLSLLMRARQLSYQAKPPEHPTAIPVPRELLHLRSDYLLLKALQRVVSLHTMQHSVDAPGAGRLEVMAVRDRCSEWMAAGRELVRDIGAAMNSTAVLQSTYPADVLEATKERLREALAAVLHGVGSDGQRSSLGTPSDQLTVSWRCASCAAPPVTLPPEEARLPPFGPLCTCVGLQWAWSDLQPGGKAELERRAECRARWWITRQGSPAKRPQVVFELLDLVQRAMLLRRPAT